MKKNMRIKKKDSLASSSTALRGYLKMLEYIHVCKYL